jgi:two-component system chemotaxis sensor kinase CheA
VAQVSPELLEIRAVFRDELRDLLDGLDRALATVHRESAPAEERSAAIRETFRVVHSLKGAARAVDLLVAERFLHAAEAAIEGARSGDLAIAEEVERVGGLVLEACRTLQPALDRDEEPEHRALDAALETLRTRASRPSLPQPAPSVPQPQRPAPEPAPREGTVRVQSSRLEDLVMRAEEVLGASSRLDAHLRADLTESLLDGVRTELVRMRAGLRTGLDAAGALAIADRALNATQTALLRTREARARARSEGAHLRGATRALVERGRVLRLARLATLTPSLERIAGEAARDLGRTVDLDIDLGEADVDRRVVDSLREPLGHVVRNAVDHGLESAEERIGAGKSARGTLRVRGVVRGRDVEIVVADDGRGLDLKGLRQAAEKSGVRVEDGDEARLAFLPGITTRKTATEVSGRGMGLDILRQRVAELHGRVEVDSTPGKGTTFRVVVPLDLSILHVLLARVRDIDIAIVTTSIERVMRVPDSKMVTFEDRLHLDVGGSMLPLADLAEALGLTQRAAPIRENGALTPCIVLAVGERRLAVRVDALIDEREVVARPLGNRVVRTPYVATATVLGDGEIALVLDSVDLVRSARAAKRTVQAEAEAARRILVVDDSVTTRQLERSILEAAGYEVVLAVDGQNAWEILASGQRFDAIVSDIEMPRMDGFGLVARVRATASTARLPIVLVTALASDADRRRALDLGADAYVVKGRFDQAELLDALDSLL